MQSIILNLIFSLVGGLGLFMFGMKSFSDGIQQGAQSKLKEILSKITQNRFFGITLGFIVTAIVQSSSAVSVMTVSFVNAELITLTQAINIILGANIGTTVTGWIVTLDINVFALPSMGIGALLILFGTRKMRTLGYVLMGFGMIFYGLSLMKDAFVDVRKSEAFRNFFLLISADTMKGKLICILIGAGLTAAIQSSSATTTIIMSLAYASLIDFPTAVAFVLGENIGTTVTANIASIGTTVNARRASLVHFLFNIIGVLYMFFLFDYYLKLVDFAVPGNPYQVIDSVNTSVTFHIAAAHTIFNIVNVIIFFFFTDWLSKISCVIYKDDKDEHHEGIRYISAKTGDVSVFALIEVKKEILHMGEIARRMIDRIIKFIDDPKEKMFKKIEGSEKALDEIQNHIHAYLLTLLNSDSISFGPSEATSMITMSTYYENLGDNLKDMVKAISQTAEKKYNFNETEKDNIKTLLSLMDHYIYYLGTSIDKDIKYDKHGKDKLYIECKFVYDFVKKYYYKIRDKHYKDVEESNTKPPHAYLYGDVLVFSNRSLSNLLNILETWTGKE